MADEMQRFLLEYRFGMQEIETKVAILRDEFSYKHDYNPIEHVSSRVKSPDSLVDKVVRKGVEPDFASIRAGDHRHRRRADHLQLHDRHLPAVRPATAQDDVTVSRSRTNRRAQGERVQEPARDRRGAGLPLDRARAVPVEVQFRTIAMDFWASLEHKIYYKYDRQVPGELLTSLKDAAHTAAELDSTCSACTANCTARARPHGRRLAADAPDRMGEWSWARE